MKFKPIYRSREKGTINLSPLALVGSVGYEITYSIEGLLIKPFHKKTMVRTILCSNVHTTVEYLNRNGSFGLSAPTHYKIHCGLCTVKANNADSQPLPFINYGENYNQLNRRHAPHTFVEELQSVCNILPTRNFP